MAPAAEERYGLHSLTGFRGTRGLICANRVPKKCALIPMGRRANIGGSADTPIVNGRVPLRKTKPQLQKHTKMKTHISHTMKAPLKSTLTALSLAILAAVAISGCESTGGASGTGTHQMSGAKGPYAMGDKAMPGAKPVATGTHQGTDIRK